MKKHILALLLAIILLVSMVPTSFAAQGFTDVPDDQWYTDSVGYAVEHGLMAGVGNGRFAPEIPMTRAMVVTVLYRIAGSPEDFSDNPFHDMPADSWFSKPVLWAVKNGITAGTSDTTFSPYADINREQMVTFLYRYASSVDYPLSSESVQNYSDAAQISGYAVAPFEWAVSAGVISGVGNNRIAPQSNATRAQCATVLMRFDQLMNGDGEADLPTEPLPLPSEPAPSVPQETVPPESESQEQYYRSEAFAREAAQWAAEYLNFWRTEQGSRSCEYLPGMEQVAMLRARQLETNFAHDAHDMRAAHGAYEYGVFQDLSDSVNPEDYGEDEIWKYQYWDSGAREAICGMGASTSQMYPAPGSTEASLSGDLAQAVGYGIAANLRNSSGHWAYIGDDVYSYLAVGVKISNVESRNDGEADHYHVDGYACVMVNDQNFG